MDSVLRQLAISGAEHFEGRHGRSEIGELGPFVHGPSVRRKTLAPTVAATSTEIDADGDYQRDGQQTATCFHSSLSFHCLCSFHEF